MYKPNLRFLRMALDKGEAYGDSVTVTRLEPFIVRMEKKYGNIADMKYVSLGYPDKSGKWHNKNRIRILFKPKSYHFELMKRGDW